MPNKPAAPSAAGKGRATSKRKPAAAKRASSQQKRAAPVEMTEEVVDRICEEIAIGRSVIEICETEDWAPAERTFHRWRIRSEEVSLKYARAKESQQHSRLDEIYRTIDACPADGAEVQKMRLKVEMMKWEASKLAPKTFGDKSTIDLNVSDVDRDDKELLHELRTVSERLGVTPDAVVSKIARPN